MSVRSFRAATSAHLIYKAFHRTPARDFHRTSPKMTVHTFDKDEHLWSAIQEKKYVFIDAYATWCGPCKAIAPMVSNWSNDEKYKHIYFVKLDVDQHPGASEKLGVRCMPTFFLFKDGKQVDEISGMNPQAIVNLLDKHLEDGAAPSE